MRRIKFNLFFVLAAGVMVITMMSACTEELISSHNFSNTSETSPSPLGIESMKYVKVSSEHVIVDADVNYGDMQNQQFPSAMVNRKRFDPEKICSIFFMNNEREVMEVDGRIVFTASDMQLNIGKGDILFETQLSKYLMNFVVTDEGQFKTIDRYQAGSLNFMSKEEAIHTATTLLDQLDIKYISEPLIYALDYQTLEKEQYAYIEKINDDEWMLDMLHAGKIMLKDKWTADNECYYIIFNANINSLPVDPKGYMLQQSDGIYVEGSRVEIIVSERGISYCRAGVIYEINENAEVFPVIQLEKALDYVVKKYEQIILSEPITIEHISLMYCPVLTKVKRDLLGSIISQEYEMVPAWIFEAKQKITVRNETQWDYFRIIINATTGQFIE